MKNIVIIPARLAATRLPNKPLIDLCGKPMIQWVYESASKAKSIDEVFVATCDQQIIDVVETFGGKAIFTSDKHTSGTDRIAEAVSNMDAKVIVNVQGDEPLIDPNSIDIAVDCLEKGNADIASLMYSINKEQAMDSNMVKVVVDVNGFALYFSRSPIPYYRKQTETINYWGHVGLYVYRKESLLTFASLKPTPLEQIESLEQLRALENGLKIKMAAIAEKSIGVDTAEDVDEVCRRLKLLNIEN